MAVVHLSDRTTIAACLHRNPRAHAYELGDLDDFEWPHTTWYGWEANGVLEQVALLYTEPSVPVLIAIAESPSATMELLIAEIGRNLPTPLYVHVTPALLGTLGERYAVVESKAHLKLALTRADLLERHALPVDVLERKDLDMIMSLYDTAYPETWFDERMLATGRYVGIRRGAELLCIAGVHVHSPPWRVAALGNVATVPELRGQGLARGACASLCMLLLADGIETIALNVAADNAAAIASYTTIGFEPVASYTEASLVAKER